MDISLTQKPFLPYNIQLFGHRNAVGNLGGSTYLVPAVSLAQPKKWKYTKSMQAWYNSFLAIMHCQAWFSRLAVKKFLEKSFKALPTWPFQPASAWQVEYILMGGTFMSLPLDYRDYFIRNLHDALSGHTSIDVKEAVQYSEQSRTKCIGLTIETRPDFCLTPHLTQVAHPKAFVDDMHSAMCY